jgi:hypothetical protein
MKHYAMKAYGEVDVQNHIFLTSSHNPLMMEAEVISEMSATNSMLTYPTTQENFNV